MAGVAVVAAIAVDVGGRLLLPLLLGAAAVVIVGGGGRSLTWISWVYIK
jgi:hypothetical protein